MEIRFSENGWEDYLFWQETDKKVVRKINFLLIEISRDPYSGPGHPERLRHDLAGCISRRIDREHRLVYKIRDNVVFVDACRYHY